MYLRERMILGVDMIHLAQDRYRQLAFVNTAMKRGKVGEMLG
jgi:hypothetical protein